LAEQCATEYPICGDSGGEIAAVMALEGY
jgi:hypothetical protein